MDINVAEAIDILRSSEDVYILTHHSPDGDTLGSGFALMNVLRGMGKRANVLCSDGFPNRYSFMYEGYYEEEFEPKMIIAVDIADPQLIGSKLSEYADNVYLCIDHHISNTRFAGNTLLNSDAAATCELLYSVFKEMGINLTDLIATCLYTGIATDTGCFKYENTTKQTHIIAGELFDYSIDYSIINRKMFDVKSKGRVMVEQYLLKNMEYYLNDKCTMITITKQIMEESGIEAAEFEGLASLTLQVEGVMVGVTIKQRDENRYKVSMRSSNEMDVSALCQQFGGGGHIRAAGCLLEGELEDIKKIIVNAIGIAIEEQK